jgi:hypothetical protein
VNAGVATSLEVWIGALLTLMVFSFLWRDNPLYKFAEHLFVGVSAAYWMAVGFWTTLWPNGVVKLWPEAVRVTQPDAAPGPADPGVWIPMLLGALMLARLVPRLAWLSRWPTAFAVGTTAGYALIRYLRSDLLAQMRATLEPGVLVRAAGAIDWAASAEQTVIVVGVVTGISYFTYSRSDRGPLGRLAQIGLVFLMVTFGASFGYAVMARLTLLVDRLHFLLGTWLGLV